MIVYERAVGMSHMYRQGREGQHTAIGVCKHLATCTSELQQGKILVEDNLTGRLMALLCVVGNGPPVLVPYCDVLFVLDAEIIVTKPVTHAKDYGTDHHHSDSHTRHFFRDCSLATESQ